MREGHARNRRRRGHHLGDTPPTHGPSLLEAIGSFGSADPAPIAVLGAVMRSIQRRRSTLADPGGTSMVSAADRDGNVVVIVHSNSFPRLAVGSWLRTMA